METAKVIKVVVVADGSRESAIRTAIGHFTGVKLTVVRKLREARDLLNTEDDYRAIVFDHHGQRGVRAKLRPYLGEVRAKFRRYLDDERIKVICLWDGGGKKPTPPDGIEVCLIGNLPQVFFGAFRILLGPVDNGVHPA